MYIWIMKRFILFFLLCCNSGLLIAQRHKELVQPLDSLYREDQLYIGFTFNILGNKPSGMKQSGFSGGLHFGFIRDMPFNKRRNWALGIGAGYSANTYNQNLSIGAIQQDGKSQFTILDPNVVSYDSNRFTEHIFEVPIELRWRTSRPVGKKFWRVYTGIRLGYLYHFQSRLITSNNILKRSDLEELNRIRVGSTFTFGWNTFNFMLYYSLNPFFNKNAVISAERVSLNTYKIGLQFYIL